MNQGNYQKTPLGAEVSRVSRQVVDTAIQRFGRELPCSVVAVNGAIVTVKFEINDPTVTLPNITIPIIGSEYVRLPIQAGCKGKTIASDAYLGGMSGLGGGVADLTPQTNLAGLVFSPIGNANWFTVNGAALTMYGPNGVTLMDEGQATKFVLSPTGIVITTGGATFTFSSTGLVVTGGDVKADTISLKTHLTSEVQTGGGTSGPPVA